MERWLVLILVGGSLASLGCQREGKKDSSTITIVVPPAANSQNKTGGVGALATMPVNRKACYGIVVTGNGLTSNHGDSCNPSAAIRAGFVEPGSTVEVRVSKGSNRTVDLFVYLQAEGLNDPCPGFTSKLTPTQLSATYKVGTAPNIDMMGDETKVDITPDFPGEANNIAVTMRMPASCTTTSNPGADAPAKVKMSAGWSRSIEQGQTEATGVKLMGRVGVALSGQASSGTHLLKVK